MTSCFWRLLKSGACCPATGRACKPESSRACALGPPLHSSSHQRGHYIWCKNISPWKVSLPSLGTPLPPRKEASA
jgi:hypothetical protein